MHVGSHMDQLYIEEEGEEKAKVVASVLGAELTQFLAALAGTI